MLSVGRLLIVGIPSLLGVFGVFIEIDYENLTKNWTSVRDCPNDFYDDLRFVGAVNGVPAYEREFAHIAAIGWTSEETGDVDWNCGGSLISENFVLTAAHCTRFVGQEPDVVRLGDRNLRRDDDDQSAQQFKIAEIIRHPEYKSNSRYHDLALLKLNDSVTFNDIVCPACIWTGPTVDFKSVEACGYGQTGILAAKSLNLLKVILRPVDNEECSRFYPAERRLQGGLKSTQICAVDPLARMDTCMGDSGGPLQIKLLGNTRMHPFLIGVTSFGKGCATTTPGVYVRLSEYTEWIQKMTGISLDPHECAHKYAVYREHEPNVINLISGKEHYDFEKAHVKTNAQPLDYIARIGWPIAGGEVDWACGGTFIHHLHVLTSASCLTSKSKESGSQPVKVKNANYFEEQEFKVEKVVLHPKFKPGHLDHDIALILLDKEVKFNAEMHPICLWDKEELPTEELEIVGLASAKVHEKHFSPDTDASKIHITARSTRISDADCRIYHMKSGLIVGDNQVCYGNSHYLVPDSCATDQGGAIIKRKNKFKASYFPYQYGVSIQGKDCGFGYPTVATRVSKYIDWIDSVIFREFSKSNSSTAITVDEKANLESTESCKLPTGGKGVCRKSSNCIEVVTKVRIGQATLMDYVCDFSNPRDPIICCPQ